MHAKLIIALLVAGSAAGCNSSPDPVVGMGPGGGGSGAGGIAGTVGNGGMGGDGGSSPSGGSGGEPGNDAGGAGEAIPDAGGTDASAPDSDAGLDDAGGGTGGGASQPDSGASACGDAVSCGDGTCQPASTRCDGTPDCSDGSDENAFFLLEQRCGSSGCHGDGSAFGDFAVSEDRAATFVGAEPILCEEAGVMIDPEDPPSSYLVQKLRGDPPCGLPMPLAGGFFSDDELACVEQWISGL